jgi:hypothetical protein
LTRFAIPSENAIIPFAPKKPINWIKQYIIFHGKRHPSDMGEREIAEFISHLATERKVAASNQNQALNAIVYLYKHVLRTTGPSKA